MLKQQHQLFVALLAAADGLVIAGASFGAWGVRRHLIEQTWWPESWEHPPKEALVLYTVPVTLLAMRWMGLYRPRRDRSVSDEIAQIFKACFASLACVLALLFVFESSIFKASYGTADVLGVRLDAGRVQLGALTALLPFLLSAERVVFRIGLRTLRSRGWNLRHVAIVGTGRVAQIVARTFERNTWTGIRVSYFVSHLEQSRLTECQGRPVVAGLRDLESALERSKPDAVYVALPRSHAGSIPDVLGRLDRFAVDVRLVPDLNPRYLPQSMAVSELDGMPILSYRENPTSGLGGVTKRALDVVGGLAAILAFTPLMLIVALLVRLSGPGPIVFRQRRVSLGGQVFDIFKFRTMYHFEDEADAAARSTTTDEHAERESESREPSAPSAAEPDGSAPADSTPGWTLRDDPRITPIGRWLRRTSLDELPQLFNVVVGDMSLVGPRPERPELIERFRDDWRGYMLRQHVKAGMTGWAQVNGLRGQSSLRKRLQYDLFYIKNWSLGFDLKILWLTLFRGFLHRNAH